ncbi:hypothetical protein QQS21_007531 [Conoideocrella luteorostrata]|uniref:Rhodopsin domain-containing protein n=1 Tax=Conoideocrella luteorostrata TaxID=1105319 RepID=A0AAJ0CNC2_9HYPO|nr:hypothetical protein QQS21_007531 [Conoideocrella luteorostrata]
MESSTSPSPSATRPSRTPTFVPSLPPPPGVTSNPNDPASLIGLANITVAISVPFLTVFFLLRVYARVFIKRSWIFEDVLVAGFYASTSIAKIWECSPREKIWNASIPGTCLDLQLILNMSGAFNMVTDYLILLIPVQAVRKLKIDKTILGRVGRLNYRIRSYVIGVSVMNI